MRPYLPTPQFLIIFLSIFFPSIVLAQEQTVETRDATATATYELTFEATWSKDTHPTSFPSNPHFSGLIGLTHNDQAVMWRTGELASTGIKNMAETGSKSPLTDEIQSFINNGQGETVISGGGIGTSPGSRSITFQASQSFPLVSVTSMIAPSPDWFVGIRDVQLFQDGNWRNEVIVDLFPYDAGTDDGNTFNSADNVTSPFVAIARIEGDPFLKDGALARLGRFILRRTDTPATTAPSVSSASSAEGFVGTAFTFTLEASGDEPITYTASGLPDGLILSGSEISGTPTAAGTSAVSITATNASGNDQRTLEITILPALVLSRAKFKLTKAGTGSKKTRDQIRFRIKSITLKENDRISLTLTGNSTEHENRTVQLGSGSPENGILLSAKEGKPEKLRSAKDTTLEGYNVRAKYNSDKQRLKLRFKKGSGPDAPVSFAADAKKQDVPIIVTLHIYRDGQTTVHTFSKTFEASQRTNKFKSRIKAKLKK